MQITRLHILLLVIGLAIAGAGYYAWKQGDTPKPTAVRVASVPARQTDRALTDETKAATPSAPAAPAPSRSTPASPDPSAATPDSYEVVKGDTLWRIARDHSPVHQGPGWVAIWRANKDTVKNFDRLETGWTLQIPDNAQAYATRYWRPRMLASRRRLSEHDEIDLAELPVPAAFTPNTPGWPPALPYTLEVALLQSNPIPRELELALLQQTPLPRSLELALAQGAHPAVQLAARTRVAPSHIQLTPSPIEISLDAPFGGPMYASLRLAPEGSFFPPQFH